MRRRSIVLFFLFLSASVHAQWLNFPTPGTPRTPDGKANLAAPTPRTADRKPDLSGVWMHELTSVDEMKRLFGAAIDQELKTEVPGMELGTVHKYAINILADFPFNASPITPKGVEAFRRHAAQADPANVCMDVPGWPLAGFLSEPIKIVQAPRLTIVLYEAGSLHRQIYSDGRALPKEINFPAFLGYSVGRWEGDVFVVDTAGFNDKTVFDIIGHSHSDQLRITERFRRIDFGHLNVEITITDPEMYTKPFTLNVPHTLMADSDLFESFCENEKDRIHLQNAKQK
jgi:hypothetical protein